MEKITETTEKYKPTKIYSMFKAMLEPPMEVPPPPIESSGVVAEEKKELFFSIGPTTNDLPFGVSTQANPITAFQGLYDNYYYDVVFNEIWFAGNIDQYFGPVPPYPTYRGDQNGFQLILNDIVRVPDVVNSPFPNAYLNDPWVHPARDWIQVLSKPIVIRAGDRITIRLYNESFIACYLYQLFKGYYVRR